MTLHGPAGPPGAQELPAPSDDQPRAQCENRQWRQKFAEQVLSSVFPAIRAYGKPQHYLLVKAEPGGRARVRVASASESRAAAHSRRRSGTSECEGFLRESRTRASQGLHKLLLVHGLSEARLPGCFRASWEGGEPARRLRMPAPNSDLLQNRNAEAPGSKTKLFERATAEH